MEKLTIDTFFTEYYTTLISVAQMFINKYNRKYDAINVVSQCYISIVETKKKINNLIAFCKIWIKQNIIWSGSQLNYVSVNSVTIWLSDELINVLDYDNDYDYDCIQSIINDFLLTLDTYHKSLFNLYYIKAIDTIEKMRNHLEICYTSAYQTIKECVSLQDKLRTYIKITKI